MGGGERRLYKASDVWALKPAWCQPWSIVSTGILITVAPGALASVLLQRTCVWPSAIAAVGVAAWWFLFLIVYPEQVAESLNRQLDVRDDGREAR